MKFLVYRITRLIRLAPKLLRTWATLRKPNLHFDHVYYAESNPHLPDSRTLRIIHYVLRGENRGFSPNRLFDPKYYADRHQLGTDPNGAAFAHYLTRGAANNARPAKLFDPAFYAQRYPEFTRDFTHPIQHFLKQGVFSGLYTCAEIESLTRKPKISIITPIYNTDSYFLKRCIESVLYQAYPNWELCLIDDGSTRPGLHEELLNYSSLDPRIKLLTLEQNGGISVASTQGLKLASGEYISFLDHDDELLINTLYEFVEQINRHDPDIMYSDEELINESNRSLGIMYKPDFDPVLLLNHNYITHFVVLKAQLLEKIKPFPEGSAGAQDHDLLLQLTEITKRILHIPLSLYKWRSSETSTSANADQKPYAVEASIRAVRHALQRRDIHARIEPGQANFFHDIHIELDGKPSFDIIVTPSLETLSDTARLKKLINNCEGDNITLHFILPAAYSPDKDLSALLERNALRLRYQTTDQPLPTTINTIALASTADFLGFVGQGVVPKKHDWMTKLAGYSQLDGTGLVGGNCLTNIPSPENKINLTCPDPALKEAVYYRNFLLHASRYLAGQECAQNTRCISSTFCIIRRETFQQVSGFNDENFPELMYDLDLSLRLVAQGFTNTYLAICRASIASNLSWKENSSFAQEKQRFKDTWKEALEAGDPHFNLTYVLNCTSLSRSEWLKWYA